MIKLDSQMIIRFLFISQGMLFFLLLLLYSMKEKIKRKKRAHVVMQWPFLQRQRFSPIFWGQTEFVVKKVNLKQEINRVYWLAKF